MTVLHDDVYVGGQFQSARNGDKETPVNNVASFNVVSRTWSAIGSGLQSARVTSLAVSEQDGVRVIYAVGTFIAASGITPFIAAYRSDLGSWMSLINATIPDEARNEYHVVAIHPKTYDVYVGGKFDKIGGGDTLRGIGKYSAHCRYSFCIACSHTRIAKWRGHGWESMAGGLGYSATINAIDFTSSGHIVIGGNIQYGTNEKGLL